MEPQAFCSEKCISFVDKEFMQSALPSLIEYIKIPNLSRNFDKEWATNGLLEQAAEHIKTWVQGVGIKGLTTQIIKLINLSPIIFTQISGDIDETYFFYGHYDKQPPFEGWNQGMGATIPVLKDEKLYGRGGADDGYATYGTMLAIKALQDQGLPIPRCVMITEGDQESGSGHIGPYIQYLKDRIGNPKVFFCLDSGTLDYERLWITTSLRGIFMFNLRVEVLTEGIHSGDASGIVPSSFRILRQLLDRIEDTKTGELHELFQTDIPPNRYKEMYKLVQEKKQDSIKEFPVVEGLRSVKQNPLSSLILRGWRAQLAIIGADGIPPIQGAGNVMLPFTEAKISIRLPPTKNGKEIEKGIVNLLTSDSPYNSKVTVSNVVSYSGFNAPEYDENFQSALEEASQTYYGASKLSLSEGMSIPFLGMLRQLWPKGQFVVTGVLGPKSNAHGPNQFLHIPYVKKLICTMAHTIAKSIQKKL